jgi:2-polyprenyl-6-methoxyphenol hydroxylase-like FAD-dependent oxidoreductase
MGHELGRTDHFHPSITERLAASRRISGFTPNHLPQSSLLKLMYDRAQNKSNLIFDTEITRIVSSKNGSFFLLDSHNQKVAEADHVVLCSGAASALRTHLPPPLSPFRMEGHTNLMSIINIHFTSKKLADSLKLHKHNAMLHFI